MSIIGMLHCSRKDLLEVCPQALLARISYVCRVEPLMTRGPVSFRDGDCTHIGNLVWATPKIADRCILLEEVGDGPGYVPCEKA